MGSVETALQAAITALASGHREQALGKLLVAWRAVKHPRIADLIDLVSAELAAQLPPIKGKTVAARMEAWKAIEKARDPAKLGRLLATPWPGTWQPALPMLEPLLEWPDDPRMGMAFARIVDETPYDTWTSDKFYRPLFTKMNKIADVRTLPLLRAQLAKDKPYYYARDMRPLEEGAVAKLETAYPDGQPPALSADAERLVAQLEAPYASELAGAKERATGDAQYFAAILADPSDLGARAVYADWLGERGDPRGEFITLQLARSSGTSSDAAIARERKLASEHGVKWAGTLANWFEEKQLEFENGFFAGGRLRSRFDYTEPELAEMLADPAWKLVRVIETGNEQLPALLDRPELANVRTVRGMGREIAEAIAGGKPRTLEVLEWVEWSADEKMTKQSPLWTCEALPQLRALGFNARANKGQIEWMKQAPVVERCERIAIHEYEGLGDLVEAAAKRGGKLRELELGTHVYRREPDAGWRVTLQRDAAPGPFTRLVARPRGGSHDIMQLTTIFEAIPKGTLRELDVASTKKVVLKEADKKELAKAVARLGTLERSSVPWESVLATPKPKKQASGPVLNVRLDGEPMLDAKKIEKVWKLVVDELGQTYDSFEVGYGSKWRPLGDDPYERAKKWAGNTRTYRLELMRDGQPGKLVLSRGKRHSTEYTIMELALGEKSYQDFVPWLMKFLDLGVFEDGSVTADRSFDHTAFSLGEFGGGPNAGWLMFFGPKYGELLPTAQVRKLASRSGLSGMYVRDTKHGMLVATAATPSEVTTKRLAALSEGMREVMTAQLPSYLGYDFTARAREVLEPVAKELGLEYDEKACDATKVAFSRGKHGLVAELRWIYDTYRTLTIDLRISVDKHGYRSEDLLGASSDAKTAAQLEKLLAAAVKEARSVGPKFFGLQTATQKQKPKTKKKSR